MSSQNDSGSSVPHPGGRRDSVQSPLPSPAETKSSPKSKAYKGERKVLDPQDISVGCIVWLPKRQPESELLICKISGVLLNDDGYDHPVVILKIDTDTESTLWQYPRVSVAVLTSFQNLPLIEYLEQRKISRKWNYRQSIPISARSDEIPSMRSLVLERERKISLEKQSYVKLSNIYDVPISDLRTYSSGARSRAYQLRLDESSYIYLMERLSRKPESYPAFDKIWETNLERRNRSGHADSTDIRSGILSNDSLSGPSQNPQISTPRRSKRLAAQNSQRPKSPLRTILDDPNPIPSTDTSSTPLLPPPVTYNSSYIHHGRRSWRFIFFCPFIAIILVVACGYTLLTLCYRMKG